MSQGELIVIVTPEIDRRNRQRAGVLAVCTFAGVATSGLWIGFPLSLLSGLGLAWLVWWLARRRCVRRLAVMSRPFAATDEAILNTRVAFYRALAETEKERFRQLVQIFLDEVRITGIRTEVDELTRMLVAASAIIPIFGFHDWDYHRLGEVLVYPGRFNREYQTEESSDRNILGLTGTGHLTGVMILSKPELLEGYANPADRQNVGIHEFAHVVEQEEVSHGLPREVPSEVVREWVAFVARELSHPEQNPARIDAYGYTNEHELLAVLTEYFFESPDLLKQRDQRLYEMLRKMFHQDPASLLARKKVPPRVGRNDLCPCGSGKKFRDCCRAAVQSAQSESSSR